MNEPKRLSLCAASAVLACLAVTGCDAFTSTETRIERAERSMAALDSRAALIELQNVLQKEPDNARARLDMAQVALQLGDVPRAERELKRALELAAGKPFPKGKNIPDSVELKTRLRLATNKGAEVLADIDSGKLAFPPALRALYRGQALLSVNRASEAQSEFEAALKADPELTRASVGLAQSFVMQRDLKRSLETLDAVTARRPDAAEAWLVKAVLLAAVKRGPEAEKALEKADALGGQLTYEQHAKVLTGLTNARLQRKDLEGARKIHARLEALSGGAPMTRILAAQIAVAAKDYEAAGAELQRVVQEAPDFVPARILLGDVLIKQNRLQQAELQLSQAVERAPNNPAARQLLSRVRKQLGRPDPEPPPAAAPSSAPAPAAKAPAPRIDPRLKRALEHQKAGRRDKAIAEYEQLLASYPKSPGVLNNLGWLYFQAGDPRALETARRAHELAPKSPEVSDTYGWILFKAGRQEEGLKLLQAAAQASKNPEIQKHYAEAQSAAGK